MSLNCIKRIIAVAACVTALAAGQQASAQYYEIANQLPGIISPHDFRLDELQGLYRAFRCGWTW